MKSFCFLPINLNQSHSICNLTWVVCKPTDGLFLLLVAETFGVPLILNLFEKQCHKFFEGDGRYSHERRYKFGDQQRQEHLM